MNIKSKTRTYRAWVMMRHRCLNSRVPGFKNYGGRGIAFCARWETFENFLQDMGACPNDSSLDRIDNNANYSQENCRWATRIEQNLNKRNNKWIELDGLRLTQSQWANRIGAPSVTVLSRLRRGWDLRSALMLPVSNTRGVDGRFQRADFLERKERGK